VTETLRSCVILKSAVPWGSPRDSMDRRRRLEDPIRSPGRNEGEWKIKIRLAIVMFIIICLNHVEIKVKKFENPVYFIQVPKYAHILFASYMRVPRMLAKIGAAHQLRHHAGRARAFRLTWSTLARAAPASMSSSPPCCPLAHAVCTPRQPTSPGENPCR